MIHIVPVEWHDLIEDPTDLPRGKENWYLVVLINKETNEIDSYGDGMEYNPEEQMWTETYDDGYGDYGGQAFFESYGTTATDVAKASHSINDEWVIAAWAEQPAHYVPQKLQGG